MSGANQGHYFLSSPRELRSRVRAGPTVAATLGNEDSPIRLPRRVAGGMRGAAAAWANDSKAAAEALGAARPDPGVVSWALVPSLQRGWRPRPHSPRKG